jgi:hypothetical protein
MTVLRTNRDFYLGMIALCKMRASNERTLEEYLRALFAKAEQLQANEIITIDDFHTLLADAFETAPAQFENAWREQYDHLDTSAAGFAGWRACILQQIVDLREMAEAEMLTNKYLHFGIDAPRGNRWYNFDPLTYLECATTGSLGGWEPGDESAHELVRGEVAVIDANGGFVSANPKDIDRPAFTLSVVTWGQFQHFIECGQCYE